MTAKELLKDHLHLARGYYVFEREELQKFVDTVCKELKDNVIPKIPLYKGTYELMETIDVILEEPTPEIFENENKQPEV